MSKMKWQRKHSGRYESGPWSIEQSMDDGYWKIRYNNGLQLNATSITTLREAKTKVEDYSHEDLDWRQ